MQNLCLHASVACRKKSCVVGLFQLIRISDGGNLLRSELCYCCYLRECLSCDVAKEQAFGDDLDSLQSLSLQINVVLSQKIS